MSHLIPDHGRRLCPGPSNARERLPLQDLRNILQADPLHLDGPRIHPPNVTVVIWCQGIFFLVGND